MLIQLIEAPFTKIKIQTDLSRTTLERMKTTIKRIGTKTLATVTNINVKIRKGMLQQDNQAQEYLTISKIRKVMKIDAQAIVLIKICNQEKRPI